MIFHKWAGFFHPKKWYSNFIKIIDLTRVFFNDFLIYFKHSRTFLDKSFSPPSQELAQIYMFRLCHSLERDLVQDKLSNLTTKKAYLLLKRTKCYLSEYGIDLASQVSLDVLFEYNEYYETKKTNNGRFFQDITALRDKFPRTWQEKKGGTITIDKSNITTLNYRNFERFVNSRHSVRKFAVGEVDINLIKRAVSLSRKSPSACNRQAVKVYILANECIKKEVLKLQGGNDGFGEQADKVLLITTNLIHYVNDYERWLMYIDGAMFAMTLVYSLHSLGLGSCCLNMCFDRKRTQRMKRILKINSSEIPIILILVGRLPNRLTIPCSQRKELEKILEII